MTPYELIILIHIFTCPNELPMPETELREEVLTKFLDQGLIYIWGDNECGYRITSLGEAWITEMLATPKPKLKYVGVTGNAINTSTIVTGLIE